METLIRCQFSYNKESEEYSYPTSGISLREAIGNTVPPVDDPKAVTPIARLRLVLNQWPMIPTTGP